MIYERTHYFESAHVALISDKLIWLLILIRVHPWGGGARKNFDRGAHVIVLGLKFDRLLFFLGGGVAQNEGYFIGVEKISIIFMG